MVRINIVLFSSVREYWNLNRTHTHTLTRTHHEHQGKRLGDILIRRMYSVISNAVLQQVFSANGRRSRAGGTAHALLVVGGRGAGG